MEYVTISVSMWDDPWVIGLTSDQRIMWLYLCSSPNNEYGFLPFVPALWALRVGLSPKKMKAVLEFFHAEKKIILDGYMVLVRKHLKHRRLRGNNLTGAVRKIITGYGDKHPAMVIDCLTQNQIPLDLWQEFRDGVESQLNGVDSQLDGVAISDQIRSDQIRSDHDTPTDKPPPRWAEFITMAKICKATIANASETHDLGKPPVNDPDKSAKVIEQCVRLDGIEDIETLCNWIMADDFWRSNMRSIPQWRKKGKNGEPKIKNALMAMRNAKTKAMSDSEYYHRDGEPESKTSSRVCDQCSALMTITKRGDRWGEPECKNEDCEVNK